MIGRPQPDAPPASYRDMWNESLRYWEPRRLLYNALLICLSLTTLYKTGDWRLITPFTAAMIVSAAGVANLCYTSAHAVDLALQWSDFREGWRRSRWILFGLGTIFSISLTGVTLHWIFHPL